MQKRTWCKVHWSILGIYLKEFGSALRNIMILSHGTLMLNLLTLYTIFLMQSVKQFKDMLNETLTDRFELNTTSVHDLDDALFGYDTMWLAALALDLAETRLENMTPSLTLGDFQYTGEKSSMIKDAIYSSGLNVTFTGASVRGHNALETLNIKSPAFSCQCM